MSDSALRLIEPQAKEIGPGMWIQRFLPQPGQQLTIGPFVFFDYVPSLTFAAGTGVDVRPHPHIGLSTLTYLLAGRMHHRDSEGHDVVIAPGDILLMTSGRGIVHSERTPQADRASEHSLHQFQLWLALPKAHETEVPSVHYAPVADLPVAELRPGLHARLAIGELAGLRAPVQSHGAPVLLDLRADTQGRWSLNTAGVELALFLVSGQVRVGDRVLEQPGLMLLPQHETLELEYDAPSRFLILGGEPLDGPRIVWWNLVASDAALIEAAKQRWQQRQFPLVPGDETEFIPLPPVPPSSPPPVS